MMCPLGDIKISKFCDLIHKTFLKLTYDVGDFLKLIIDTAYDLKFFA